MSEVVDVPLAFNRVEETWRPKIVAEVNDHELKVVKVHGDFPWHAHVEVDELFFVWTGDLRLEFEDRILALSAGQVAVAPRGVMHRTASANGAEVLIFKRRGVVNTGDAVASSFTAPVGAKL